MWLKTRPHFTLPLTEKKLNKTNSRKIGIFIFMFDFSTLFMNILTHELHISNKSVLLVVVKDLLESLDMLMFQLTVEKHTEFF